MTSTTLRDLLGFALVTFSSIFFVVDPLAIVPTFLAMTVGDSAEKKRAMAKKAGLATTVTLVIFAVAGSVIFKVFGITLGAFRVAGGVLLFLLALDMMRATPSKVRQTREEEEEGSAKEDIAIIPLTIPMLAGPGAIATTMVCVANSKGDVVQQSVIVACIVVTGLVTWLTLRSAVLIEKRLGATGLNVLARVMGLIVAAIAVQYIVGGVKEVWGA
jgi:multiple antibiotic resistance protein